LLCVDPIGFQDAVGKNEGRGTHSWYTDPLAAKVFRRLDVAIRCGLEPKTPAMYSGGELHIQPLLNRLEQVHDQIVIFESGLTKLRHVSFQTRNGWPIDKENFTATGQP
jgi:hypothetical protein